MPAYTWSRSRCWQKPLYKMLLWCRIGFCVQQHPHVCLCACVYAAPVAWGRPSQRCSEAQCLCRGVPTPCPECPCPWHGPPQPGHPKHQGTHTECSEYSAPLHYTLSTQCYDRHEVGYTPVLQHTYSLRGPRSMGTYDKSKCPKWHKYNNNSSDSRNNGISYMKVKYCNKNVPCFVSFILYALYLYLSLIEQRKYKSIRCPYGPADKDGLPNTRQLDVNELFNTSSLVFNIARGM